MSATVSPRPPRLRVLANGAALPGAISFRVTANNYFHASTYQTQIALFADPKYGPGWWGEQDSTLTLDIQASLDGGKTWKSLILGQLDSVDLDLGRGTVQASGRDLSARLIDNRTQEAFQNQTSSQIAQKLAARAGLTADVQATSTPVGRFYSADHEVIRLNQFSHVSTEWDMLVYLAQHEQFLVWVTGTTLHFKPPPPSSSPFVVSWGTSPFRANVEGLTMQRSLTLAKDAVVGVRSWDSRHAHGFTKWAPHAPVSSSGTAQQFLYVFPNLTEDQAQKKAQALLKDITKHERVVEFQAPADLTLTPQQMVRVQGTGSSWDQSYYIDQIARSMDVRGGFSMHVRCKNHSPESQPSP